MTFAAVEIIVPAALDELLLVFLHLPVRSRWALHAQARDQRNGESQGLARTGLAASEDVPTGQCVRDGVDLNGECGALPVRSEGSHQNVWNAELREGCG
jgi:hypothetical protein